MTLAQNPLNEIEARARRYLAGQLSQAEEESFENQMVSDPEVARQVDLTRRLRAGLLQLKDTGRLEHPAKPAAPRRQRSLHYALAATVLLAGGTFFYLLRPEPASILAGSARALQSAQSASREVQGPYVVTQVRGATRAGDAPPLVIPLATPRTLIRLDVYPPNPSATYEVELRSATDRSRRLARVRIPSETANAASIAVFLDSSRLAAGRYSLELSANDGTKAVYEIAFVE